MKKRTLIGAIVVLAILVCLVMLISSPKNELPVSDKVRKTSDEQSKKTPIERHAPSNTNISHGPELRGESGGQQLANSNAFREWLNGNDAVEMEFYGKVVDDEGKPITGAVVSFSWDEQPLGRRPKSQTTASDADGLFTLHHARGGMLSVRVSKEGFYLVGPPVQAFRYSLDPRHFPDPANPVIFKLRKKGIAEPLIHLRGTIRSERQYRLASNGTPIEISLYTGEQVAQGQGQFRVEYWIDRSSDAGQRHLPWRCRFTIPGGGMRLITEDFPFLAPADVYQENVEIASSPDVGGSRFKKSYFIHLPDGKFGRINFSLFNGPNPYFGIEAFINPSGSRNLEFDPDSQPKDTHFE